MQNVSNLTAEAHSKKSGNASTLEARIRAIVTTPAAHALALSKALEAISYCFETLRAVMNEDSLTGDEVRTDQLFRSLRESREKMEAYSIWLGHALNPETVATLRGEIENDLVVAAMLQLVEQFWARLSSDT